MSYKEKPQLKLYTFENGSFVPQAIIDDYKDASFQRNMYQAGAFTITINYNIPNAQKFERGMFIQFGNDEYDFGEILKIQDAIGKDGKGSQIRTITGYDSRYILKRRVIKNLNDGDNWSMTSKGELCIRNLVLDQCGANAEEKRRLPISNTIPAYADAVGKEYSVKEQFTNLYEVCKTIATQTEIGWRMKFNGNEFILECYEGEDKSQIVQFSPEFDSLSNGEFVDTNESFSNAIYIGGKGQNTERDIYEGENLIEETSPSGLDRFESWDNQSQMTNEDEYEAEAKSMLTQYGQTLQMSGNGLVKCPYIYKEQYDVGDWITVSFSNKKAVVQILSVEERWAFGNYEINFSFGKPKNNLSDQLQLMLRKIQVASSKGNYIDSVRWYEIPTDTEMAQSEVTFNTIGFTGTIASGGSNFILYIDDEKTGSKTYRLYVKNLYGTDKLTLKTNIVGSDSLKIPGGSYVALIYVDDDGNVKLNSMTPTNVVEKGNNAPVTSDAVAQVIGGGVIPIGFIMGQYRKVNFSGWLYLDGRNTTGTDDELSTKHPGLYMYLGNTNILPDYREFALVGAELNTTDVYNASTNPNGIIHTHDTYIQGQAKDDQFQNHGHSISDPGHSHAILNFAGSLFTPGGNFFLPYYAPGVSVYGTNSVSTGISVINPNSGNYGNVTRGKRKAVFFYIRAD